MSCTVLISTSHRTGAGGATAVASPEEEEADARAGSAAAVASASEKEAASAGKTGKKPAWPQQQSRKNHEVHPGSYAGGLPKTHAYIIGRACFL